MVICLSFIVNEQFFQNVTQAQWKQSKNYQIHLKAYDASEIKHVGTCKLKLCFKNKCFVCMFYIVECEKALGDLPHIEKNGIFSVHCDSILIQEPPLYIQLKMSR